MPWLLSLLGFARTAAQGALSLVRRYPLAVALGVALLLCWHLLERGNRYRDKYAAVIAAQAKAGERQAEVLQRPAILSKAIAEKSNVDAEAYYAAGRRAGLAYRMRPEAHCPRAADLPGTDRAAQVDDGPGVAPGMVALSAADFDLLTGNSLRLAKVREDAAALIEAGVVVSLDGKE